MPQLKSVAVNSGDRSRQLRRTRSLSWIRLSMIAATLGFVGSIVALANPRVYDSLTVAFRAQAFAQDVANLVVSPLLLVVAILALRGSLRAYLAWLGVVAFTLYSYVIYAFSIPFGLLFPVFVAVLGMSLFSLIGGLLAVDAGDTAIRYGSRRAIAVSAYFLTVVAGLFALLWLSEDVPALFGGSLPQSVIDLAIPTNPVHVLDYVFFLPAAIITGRGLLRGRRFAYVSAPAFFVLLALTCVPILLTPFFLDPMSGNVGVAAIISTLAVTLTLVLVWLLRSIRDSADSPTG